MTFDFVLFLVFLLVLLYWFICKLLFRHRSIENVKFDVNEFAQSKCAQLLETTPAVIVDIEQFDSNCLSFAKECKTHSKKLRIATKSIRCVELIERIVEQHSPILAGLMCYSVQEAAFLLERPLLRKLNVLIAYPRVTKHDVQLLCTLWKSFDVVCMIDSKEHIDKIVSSLSSSSIVPSVCIDCDMSLRIGPLHLGVRRSPLFSANQVVEIAKYAQSRGLRVVGIMGYEAQIAGIGQLNPFSVLLNPIVELMKVVSQRSVARRREAIVRALMTHSFQLDFVNGGGTGSIETTCRDVCVTEVAVGSGFLQSHLFDYYRNNSRAPALAIVLSIERKPADKIICVHGGGFIGSGKVSNDKSPQILSPKSCLNVLPDEGWGEVQTPLSVSAPSSNRASLELSDFVIARPAKAGEIAERFQFYVDVDTNAKYNTYRGMGQCFH